MIVVKYDLCSLLSTPPSSDEELFSNIKRCVSIFSPEWIYQLKPSTEERIQRLEQLVREKFGQELPSSYKMYLKEMGGYDGGLLSEYIDVDINDMAQWAQEHMERGNVEECIRKNSSKIPPFWQFCYAYLGEYGFGFSTKAKIPDQLIMTNALEFYNTHDTFPKFLFYSAYMWGMKWIRNHGEILEYSNPIPIPSSDYAYLAYFWAVCPEEWMAVPHSGFIDLLRKLESYFSFEECWFSGNKEFTAFDTENCPISVEGFDARYVAVQNSSGLIICIHSRLSSPYQPNIGVYILGRDIAAIKQVVDTILQHIKLYEDISLRMLKLNLNM